jgi:hypothetical protein
MKKEFVTATSRAIALAGLIAVNTALPAEASSCYACLCFSGWPCGCLSGQSQGHHVCASHGDHCDQFYSCSS